LVGKFRAPRRRITPAVRPFHQNTYASVFAAGTSPPWVLAATWHYCREQQYDLAVISAFTRQRRLYEHLGFVPFGPVIGTEQAAFQPMMLTLERFRPRADMLFGGRATSG